MLRRLLPIIWVIIMYAITGLTESGPPLKLAESGHIAVHLSGYALLALLLAAAYLDHARRTLAILLILALLIGVGQEVLQNLVRDRLYIAASLFDLGVDTIGASLGLLGYHRLKNWNGTGKD